MTESREHSKLYEGVPAGSSMPAYVRAILRVVVGPTCLVRIDGEPLPKRFFLRPNDSSPGGYEIRDVSSGERSAPEAGPHLYARRRSSADEELAINLLADAAGLQAARHHYAAFARDVVSLLPVNDPWILPEAHIKQWLEERRRA